jgi:hypothetical protein
MIGFCRKFSPATAGCMMCGNGVGGTAAMIEFKGSHFEREMMLWGIRWYVAYPISNRHLYAKVDAHPSGNHARTANCGRKALRCAEDFVGDCARGHGRLPAKYVIWGSVANFVSG